jgi:hypothetical protein
MIVYEVYLRNEKREDELIGIFPERRINRDRATSDSLDEWLKMVLGDTFDASKIFIVRKEV